MYHKPDLALEMSIVVITLESPETLALILYSLENTRYEVPCQCELQPLKG